jgi:hypothetical protein
MRKVVHLIAAHEEDYLVLYALCDDGSIWRNGSPEIDDIPTDWVKVASPPKE